MDFTLQNVVSVGGDDFEYTQSPSNGNIKVDIKGLADSKSRNLTDDEKVDMLVALRQRMKDAGFNANIRLSSRRANGTWSNWPHLWVNNTLPAATNVTGEIAELKAQISELMGLIAGKVNTVTQTQTETEETPTPEVEF